ncbi:MAG: tRNA uridine-5-carboxymethylaminomethyl(34) synthesis GTPase MnmE [Myxococcaceae bacterium]
MTHDTICALATPPGQSALAIIRVSGLEALEIKNKIFKPRKSPQKHFVVTRGDILDLDDALCVSFPEHQSFTGEPSFELYLHGSPIIAQKVLESLQALGCRGARPGEFSLRAYLSGKIDLCEAESIADLIHARSEQAAKVALRNLKGGLSDYLESTRLNLIDILCEIEARLDFPDEDLGALQRQVLADKIQGCIDILSKLLRSAQLGKRLTEGARVVLLGHPNAGKSTLLNAFLGEEKALVHETPGTTRDVIEASWVLEGMPLILVDIAGIREGANLDPVERLGIEKAKQELDKADLILLLQEPGQEKLKLDWLQAPVLEVTTKKDLYLSPDFAISAKTGEGLDKLREKIKQILLGDTFDFAEVMLTKVRQKEEVQKARECLLEAHEAVLRDDPDEVLAFELRSAGNALDRLLGKSLNEEVLDLIFSRFCIGK